MELQATYSRAFWIAAIVGLTLFAALVALLTAPGYPRSELSRDHGDLCKVLVAETDHDENRFELSPASTEKFARLLHDLRDRWDVRAKSPSKRISLKTLYTVELVWADGERHIIHLGGFTILGPDAYVQLTHEELSVLADCLGDPRIEFRDYPWNSIQRRPSERKQLARV